MSNNIRKCFPKKVRFALGQSNNGLYIFSSNIFDQDLPGRTVGSAKNHYLFPCQISFLGIFIFLLISLPEVSSFNLDSCNSPLGMESGTIKNDQITASSSYDLSVTGPSLARLNIEHLGGAWCPKGMVGERNIKHFLEIDLQKIFVISSVETQGRFGNGQGVEYVEFYLLEYWRPGFREWKTYKLFNGSKILNGNINTYITVKHSLVPPIIGNKVRFIPHSPHPRTVCMRVEMIGCRYQDGLVTYSMPQGLPRGLDIGLTDASYDGIVTQNFLTGGLGQLADGIVGDHSYKADLNHGKGYEWVGWKNETGNPLEILFQFDTIRNFSSLAIYTSNMFSKETEVFSKAILTFSADGRVFSNPIEYTYMPDRASEYARNVTINLRKTIAKYIKMQLHFASRWLMVSEVYFNSGIPTTTHIETLKINSSQLDQKGKSREENIDEAEDNLNDSSGYMHDGAQVENTQTNLVREIQEDGKRQRHVALVIGVLVAVILVLMVAILFIFWRAKRQKTGGLSHDLLPGPFGEKRDIVSLKDVRKFLTPQAVRPFLCSPSALSSCRSSAAAARPVGMDGGRDTTAKTVLYSEPFQVSYGSTYTTAKRIQRTIPVSSPDYTECGSTDYAIPQLQGGSSESSPYRNLLPHMHHSSHQQLSSFINSSSTPVPMSPHLSTNGEKKSSERLFHTTNSRPHPPPPPPENFYAATEIVKAGVGETTSSAQVEGGTSFGDDESIGSSLESSYPPEIPRHKIKFLQQIGDGQFGEVHIGHVEMEDGRTQLTAIKTLRLEASAMIRCSFEREVDILGSLKDTNIVAVIGICSNEEPLCMLVEYCEHGDLHKYLQNRIADTASPRGNAIKTISYGTLIYMATQIASGMKYLEDLNFVHRDLATRNCLVGSGQLVKICDFGMSRSIYSSDYYRVNGKILLPVRWMAWEPLLLGKFTTKSDVWAFAVTLWEILTMAREKPFAELSDDQVIENISFLYHNDVRKVFLSHPQNCPKEIYDLMKECWNRSDVDRPTFNEIHMFLLRKNLGYAPLV